MSDIDDALKALGQPDPTPANATQAPSKVDDAIAAIGGEVGGAQPTGYTLGQVALGTAQNLATGAVREVSDALWGPVIMAVNKFSPGAAKTLYDKVTAPTPLTAQNPAAPVANYIGESIGLGAALAAGPEGIAGTAATGAFLGATSLKDPADQGSRIGDAILGATTAVIGRGTGELVTSGVAKLLNNWGADRLVALAKDSVQGMAQSGIALRDKINSTFTSMLQKARGNYALKDIHGNRIVGVNSLNLGDDLNLFARSYKMTDTTKEVFTDATKTIIGADADLPLLKGMKPTVANSKYMSALNDFASGKGDKLPTDSYEPGDLFMSYARVERAWKAEKNRTTKSQLSDLRNLLDQEVKRVAAGAGRSATTIKAKAASLEQYYRENITPFTDYFGLPKTYNPPITSMTALDFDKKIIQAFEGTDPEKFAKIVPIISGHETHVAQLIMQKALNSGVDGKKYNLQNIGGYFKNHQAMIERLPKEYQDMMNGFVNYLGTKPPKGHFSGHHFDNWITGGGVLIGLEHVFQGEPLRGAMYAASTVAALATMRQFTKLINNPVGRRFMSAASKLTPNSPKWARMLEYIAPLMAGGAGMDYERKPSDPKPMGNFKMPTFLDGDQRP